MRSLEKRWLYQNSVSIFIDLFSMYVNEDGAFDEVLEHGLRLSDYVAVRHSRNAGVSGSGSFIRLTALWDQGKGDMLSKAVRDLPSLLCASSGERMGVRKSSFFHIHEMQLKNAVVNATGCHSGACVL